jgi:hypothetical protein
MIERRYRQLKIIEVVDGDDSSLLFGAFTRQKIPATCNAPGAPRRHGLNSRK